MTTTQETDGPPRASDDLDEARAEETDAADGMSRQKRLGISVLIVLILLGVFASTMPKSEIKAGLLDVTRPFLLVTGLDQAWGVFAPSPPRTSNEVLARVDRADGTVGVYPLAGSDGLAEFWDYRWRKYGEQLWKKRNAERERTAISRWVSEQDRESGHVPTRVTLLRINRANLPAGPGPDAGAPREIPFFSTPVGSR